MTLRHLDKAQCQPYFARLSQALGQRRVEVDIGALGLPSPYARAWTSLKGVAYDPDKDTFQLVTDTLDHLIPNPLELMVDGGDDGLHAIEVVDAGGNVRTVRLRTPLPLEHDA